MSGLIMVRQRLGAGDDAPWIVESGRAVAGRDGNDRLASLEAGLRRHAGVRAEAADAGDDEVEAVLAAVHEPGYLDALRAIPDGELVVLPALAPPGLEPDIPVGARLVAAAHEAVRTAVAAARRVAAGERYAYAVCRPPGHHAGPAYLGGYCYLNTAAAAARTLVEAGVRPVGIVDLDLHYPNGTAAIVAAMDDARLHSLHAWPVANAPGDSALPLTERETVVEFAAAPDEATYLEAVAAAVAELAAGAAALVVSLGYDTVRGDPHGHWALEPGAFAGVGRILAGCALPVCVVQEGGYALDALADCSHAFATGLLGDDAP